jgi:putative transcriptional regulator
MTSQLDTIWRGHDGSPELARYLGMGCPGTGCPGTGCPSADRLGTGRLGAGQPARMKNQVRALRIAKDMAQGQLAEAMGVSRQTINSIENERYTPSLPLAMALARYFGVTIEEMFDDQD